MTPDAPHRAKAPVRLRQLLRENDFEGLEALFRSFFAGIPYQWHVKNDIARYEGYYASVFYSWFAAAGLDVRVEDSASRGRLDMAALFNEQIYLFEFKTVEKAPEGGALAQIKEKGYADKYRHLGQPIHLIGVEFSPGGAQRRRIRGRARLTAQDRTSPPRASSHPRPPPQAHRHYARRPHRAVRQLPDP